MNVSQAVLTTPWGGKESALWVGTPTETPAPPHKCPHRCGRDRHPEPLTRAVATMYDNHQFREDYDPDQDDSRRWRRLESTGCWGRCWFRVAVEPRVEVEVALESRIVNPQKGVTITFDTAWKPWERATDRTRQRLPHPTITRIRLLQIRHRRNHTPLDRSPQMKTSEFLAEARDTLERDGWAKGAFNGPGGSVCAIQALKRTSMNHLTDGGIQAFEPAKKLLQKTRP